MKNFENKVAVITGAGSGIGRGIAETAADNQMHLVLADVDEIGLNETLEIVKSKGIEAIARVTDVSKLNEVENLASQTYETFQNCHLLFNNAGVLGPAPMNQVTREMYDWLININLGGCFNGVHSFLPKMQSSGEESHIIATCSTSGFIAYPMLGLYSASKFGIRGLMTSLKAELAGSNIGVSIVCPGEVTTNIVNSTFNQNSKKEVDQVKQAADADPKALLEVAAEDAQNTYPISPSEAAQAIFSGIQNQDFYIFTHKGYKRQLEDISVDYLQAFDQAMFQ